MVFHRIFVQRYWSYLTSDALIYFPLWKYTPKFSIGIIAIDIWINLALIRKLNHHRDLAHRLRCERIRPWPRASSNWLKDPNINVSSGVRHQPSNELIPRLNLGASLDDQPPAVKVVRHDVQKVSKADVSSVSSSSERNHVLLRLKILSEHRL